MYERNKKTNGHCISQASMLESSVFLNKPCFPAVEPAQLGMWIFLFKKELLAFLRVWLLAYSSVSTLCVFRTPRGQDREPDSLGTVVMNSGESLCGYT